MRNLFLKFIGFFTPNFGAFFPPANAIVETGTQVGSASYATGGFTVSTNLSVLDWFGIEVQTPGANVKHLVPVITRNSPATGQATVKLMMIKYDKLTSIDAITGLPAGVTAQGTAGQTYDAEAAHVHSLAHDHAATASTNNTNSGGGAQIDLTSPVSINVHAHSFDVPNHTGNTGVGSSHTHTWDNIYQHQHALTNTETNTSLVELANGTDISDATFIWKAIDIL